MTPDTSTVRGVADKALDLIAKVRPGSASGRRSLPIRCDAEVIRARGDDPQQRAARDARLRPPVLARGIQVLGPLLARQEPFLVAEAAAA
jgi:hypothetical protein